MTRDVLEKSINKRPLLCRWGFHRYKPIAVLFGAGRMFVTFRCQRCPAETTEVE